MLSPDFETSMNEFYIAFLDKVKNFGLWDHVGLWASILLPFFNIPMMMRLYKRKSSEDLSLIWVLGVFFCLAAMEPAGWQSKDFTFQVFTTINLLFFSGVTFMVLYYRFRK